MVALQAATTVPLLSWINGEGPRRSTSYSEWVQCCIEAPFKCGSMLLCICRGENLCGSSLNLLAIITGLVSYHILISWTERSGELELGALASHAVEITSFAMAECSLLWLRVISCKSWPLCSFYTVHIPQGNWAVQGIHGQVSYFPGLSLKIN